MNTPLSCWHKLLSSGMRRALIDLVNATSMGKNGCPSDPALSIHYYVRLFPLFYHHLSDLSLRTLLHNKIIGMLVLR